MLSDRSLRQRLAKKPTKPADSFVISPLLDERGDAGGAIQGCAIDLRLGTWFEVPRLHSLVAQRVRNKPGGTSSERPAKTVYIPFGSRFILHPRKFVLGVTLEWIRMPDDLAATVTGKSKWGRRGLNIATATLVHPYFVGCLTLELANIGEHPIELVPGMAICQMAVHKLQGQADMPLNASDLIGRRRAVQTPIDLDERALALAPNAPAPQD